MVEILPSNINFCSSILRIRPARAVIILTAALVLEGCKLGPSAGAQPTNPCPGPHRTTVVFGIAAANAIDFKYVWTRFDPKSGRLLNERIILENRCVSYNGKCLTPNQPVYHVRRVVPGSYISTMTVVKLRGQVGTNISRYVRDPDNVLNAPAGRFRVKKGDVIYLGNIRFDPTRFPTTVVGYHTNLGAAKLALSNTDIFAANALRLVRPVGPPKR